MKIRITLIFDQVPEELRERMSAKDLEDALQDRETLSWLCEAGYQAEVQYDV